MDGTGSVDFGSTVIGTPVTQVITVSNIGTADLTLGTITVPAAGYSVAVGFGQTTLSSGQSTDFTLQLDALATGSFAGVVSFDSNDLDENPFEFDVNGTVPESDDDGDGVPNSSDLCPGTAPGDPVDINGCSAFQVDTDLDGLSDGDENLIGTNPLLDDTDDDGFKDGMELRAGYDPLVGTSFPVWGDINDDRVVNAADVLKAVRAISGEGPALDSAELARGNVAPLVGGVPNPPLTGDNFDTGDLLLIIRKASNGSLY